MRIIPIINTEVKLRSYKGGNVAQNSAYLYLNVLNLGYDSFSFKAAKAGMSPKDFKKLAPYMVDLYSGSDLLTNDQLNKMIRRGFFKGEISAVIKKIKPYTKKYLEPIEYAVFEIMEKEAGKNPTISINELFNSLYYRSLKQVEKAQKPLFEHMKAIGAELPYEYAEKFADYMKIVDKKIAGEPIVKEFSQKEFIYKLTKLSNNVTDSHLKSQIKVIIKEFNKNKADLAKKFRKNLFIRDNRPVFNTAKKIKALSELEETALSKGYKRIAHLCEDNINMLKGLPVYVPFSNKAFTYDITQILENLPDMRAKREILSSAIALPNSMSSMDALILKFKDSQPDIIGERLFNPSLVSVEHLKPQSEGGLTNIKNCALARRGPNSRRGSEPLYLTLQRYPYKNQQKYVNRLTVLVKIGLINAEDALGQIETIEREGLIQLNKTKLLKLAELSN